MKLIRNNFVPVSIAALILCVGLYQFSFWECFAFNPMSILTFQEFVTSGISPLVYSILASIIVTVVIRLGTPRQRFYLNEGVKRYKGFFIYKYSPPPRSAQPFIRTRKVRIILICFVFFGIGTTVIGGIWSALISDWIGMLWLLCYSSILGTFYVLGKNGIFWKYFKSADSYIFSLFFFTALPFISISSGLHRATRVINNTSYDYIILKENRKVSERYKLLNVGPSTLILCSLDNKKIILLQRDKISKLIIMHHVEYKTYFAKSK